jgi:ABC-type phosphonate transport system ATPase subunit
VSLLLDAGALIALERRPADIIARIDDAALHDADIPLIPATVLAQVWRSGSGRQARLAALLPDCQIDALDLRRAQEVGRVLARAGTHDVADAHVVVAAKPEHLIVTSDPIDIARLAKAAGVQVRIAAV